DRDLGLVWRSPYERVLDSSRGIPWTTWWIGGRMNYVATALRHDPSRTALVFEGEEGTTRRLTYGELAAAVRRFAAGLRALGVRPGDRVGIFLPMIPDCAIATLAVSAIGAVYTSGTTGRPKGAVHVHGGFPVKAAQDLAHCFDLQPGDLMWWFTDLGWMMGPWLIAGGLILGASILLYDGAPDFPDPGRVWSIVERHRVTHLGISPTAIRGLMRAGEVPVRAHDRSSLVVLGSTGEPWN